jgi:hypothetical protein
MEDDILSLLDPTGGLRQRAEGQARSQGLLNLGFALLQASRGQPGQGKPSLGQVIGQAGPVGLQAYQQTFDKTLADALRGMQIQEMQKRKQQQEAGRTALKQAYERMSGLSPQGALAMQGGQAGPTVQRAEMIGQRQPMSPQEVLGLAMNPNIDPETQKNILTAASLMTEKPKESFRPLTPEEAKSRGLPADRSYQISSSGRVDEVGKGPLVVFPEKGATDAMWTEVGKELPKLATQARAANQTNQALSNLVEMGEKKTFSGLLAPGQIGASQFLTSFGVKVAPETLANSRTFQAASNVLVLDFMASMGGARGFSKEESAILYDAFPKIIDDPKSRTRIANMLIDRNNRIIDEFKTTKSSFEQATKTKTPFQDVQPLRMEQRERPASGLSDQGLIDRYLRR